MKRLLIIALLCLAASAWSATTEITSLPYTANQTGTNYSETLYVTSELSSATNGINVTGHDIVILLRDTLADTNYTMTFATGNADSSWGLRWWGDGTNGCYNIKVIGGNFYDGSTDDSCHGHNAIHAGGGRNLYMENVNLYVKGYEGNTIMSHSGSYKFANVEINGGHWWSDVTGYDSRTTYYGGGAVLGYFDTSMTGYEYSVKIRNLHVDTTQHAGLVVNAGGGEIELYQCSVWVDADNPRWTDEDYETGNFAWGSTNAFSFIIQEAHGLIDSCFAGVGGTYDGHDGGFLFEKCRQLEVKRCKVIGRRGFDAHYGVLNWKGMKMRWGPDTLDIHDNEIYGYVEDDSSYGSSGIGFEWTDEPDEGMVHGVGSKFYNNKIVMTANDVGYQDCWGVRFTAFDTTDESNWDGEWYGNHITSPHIGYQFDTYDGGADSVMVDRDTIVIDTIYADAHDHYTFFVGNNEDAPGCIARDLVYLDQASDTAGMAFLNQEETFDRSLYIQATPTITVNGNNALPVSDAKIGAINAYGDTAWFDTSDASGQGGKWLNYWYEAEDTPDSTSFNPITFFAASGSDSVSWTTDIAHDNTDTTVTLTETAGEAPAATVTRRKIKGMKIIGGKI